MFDNVSLEYFEIVRRNDQCEMEYCKMFRDMVEEKESIEKSIINHERELIGKSPLKRKQFTYLKANQKAIEMDSELRRFMTDNKPLNSKGVDSDTWSKSCTGKITAPPWLFAMMCALTKNDLKKQLDRIIWRSKPNNVNLEIDALAVLQEAGYVKNVYPRGLSEITFEFTDYAHEEALRKIVNHRHGSSQKSSQK